MRLGINALAAFTVVCCVVLAGCRNGEVLVDNYEKTIVRDSTTIRVLNSVPDSSMLIISSTTDWSAGVAKGDDWCYLSKTRGKAGRDTIFVHVKENTTPVIRSTSVTYDSGTILRIFKVVQGAGESWFDVPYWQRTALQRAGLRGKVRKLYSTDVKNRNKLFNYTFDERGNLLTLFCDDEDFNRFDTTRIYTYDDSNHRLTCMVQDEHNVVARSWRYEYRNTGRLVAFSAIGWNDPDPLAEDMTRMVVPDLSAATCYWSDGGFDYGQRRCYIFDDRSDGTLFLNIITSRWKLEGGSDSIPMGCDTARVEYRNGLPFKSVHVSYSSYNKNGMLKVMETDYGKFEFLDNVQKMVPTKFTYNKATKRLETEWYECSYNFNRDPLERKVQYKDVDFVTVDRYVQYQYDNMNNWIIRMEEIPYPGTHEAQDNVVRRELEYF